MTPKHSMSRLLSTCFLLSVLSLSHATVVRMDFAIGSQSSKQIFIELLDLPFPDGAPETVANFLRYIEYTDPDTNEAVRRYDNTFIHRSKPGFVIQGGGIAYTPNPGGENFARDMSEIVIDTTAEGKEITVDNEFDVTRSNVRGTVAMAKVGGDPDSATSQWFINLDDNSFLNNQNGGFTVFGRVIGMTADNIGATVADDIAALSTVDKTGVHSAFTDLPLFGYTQGDPIPEVTSSNLVTLTRVAVIDPVQPSLLDMGITLLNNSAPTQTVTIQNLTDTAFTITKFSLDRLAAPFNLSSETCSEITLIPLQTCTLFIDFTPTEAGQKNASFRITTNSLTLSSLSVLVTGTGTENLKLSSNCSSLTTGDSCTVSITFTFSPSSAGIATEAQLEILSNDPDVPSSIIQITGETSSDHDGVPDAIEAAVSSSGDSNLDGIADILQDNVASLPDTFGRYSTLETEPGILMAKVVVFSNRK